MGTGGASVQPATVETKTATYVSDAASPSGITTRAASGIKAYWNIKTGNNTIPVAIADVSGFKFTADNTLVFTLKNGTTMELANYQGIDFTLESVSTTNSKWDMEKTLKYGRAAYEYEHGQPINIRDKAEYISIVTTDNNIIIYDVFNKKELK